MRVSSKGRYAVTAIVFLAKQDRNTPMSLSQIADLQEISLSYLEQLFSKLRVAGIVKSIRGPGGGYILSRSPNKILISDIIGAVEIPTPERKLNKTDTNVLWEALGNQVFGFLRSISVEDICEKRIEATETEVYDNFSSLAVAR
tara:strand:+ start:2439 stop:2870 length:432 start_codon:yes stop_codon:yes gene_type:complete